MDRREVELCVWALGSVGSLLAFVIVKPQPTLLFGIVECVILTAAAARMVWLDWEGTKDE